LSSNLDKMTDEEQNKYKQFLQNELRKLDEQDNTIAAAAAADDNVQG
jgi:hypothetical protein